jgi:hypothetical protein
MNPLARNRQNTLPRVAVFSSLIIFGACQTEGAAFQNLDFESSPSFPAGSDNPPYTIQPTALPGWTVHIGDTIQNGAWANQSILDSPFVALMTDSRNLLEGQKSVLLQSTFSNPIGFPGAAPINVAISQTGLVPADSLSLHFKALNPFYSAFPIPPGPLDIQLGGTSLSLIPTYSNGGYVEYGADVSAWQGQTVELSIKVLTTPAYSANFPEGVAYLDSFTFSPTEAPEPGFISLVMFGSALLAWRLYQPSGA